MKRIKLISSLATLCAIAPLPIVATSCSTTNMNNLFREVPSLIELKVTEYIENDTLYYAWEGLHIDLLPWDNVEAARYRISSTYDLKYTVDRQEKQDPIPGETYANVSFTFYEFNVNNQDYTYFTNQPVKAHYLLALVVTNTATGRIEVEQYKSITVKPYYA